MRSIGHAGTGEIQSEETRPGGLQRAQSVHRTSDLQGPLALQRFAEATRQPGPLDIPPLVENGNSVPVTVTVESPMTTADFVKSIALFNERNPQPNVAHFHLAPRAGRATVSTRIRLGDSQNIVAIAQMSDGSFWSDSAELIVTLPACVET